MSSQIGKVLVIDDNEQMLTLAEDTLGDAGYGVLLARNGTEGLEAAKGGDVDVTLLDVMMPGMNGYEVCKLLREARSGYRGKIIMLSAKAHSKDKVNGLNVGADDYLTKPYHTDELVARVNAQYRIKKVEDERAGLLRSIQEDIAFGATIQERYLTKIDDVKRIFNDVGFQVSVYNKAPNTISGDFFFAKPVGGKSAGLFIADMCGHGMAAALLSMRILSIIDHLRSPMRHPSEFLEMLNGDIQGLIPERRFVASAYIILDETGIAVSNAAQPYPILVKSGHVSELKVSSPPLGMHRAIRYEDQMVGFGAGDRLILYTDGLTEASNQDDEVYGEERLLSIISRHHAQSAGELTETIMNDMHAFTAGKGVDDDITLIVVERNGG